MWSATRTAIARTAGVLILAAALPAFARPQGAAAHGQGERAGPDAAGLKAEVLPLVGQVGTFGLLDDLPTSEARAILKRLATAEGRRAVLAALLPLAMGHDEDPLTRDDALRVIVGALGRADRANELQAILEDPELSPSLPALADALYARAEEALAWFLRSGGTPAEGERGADPRLAYGPSGLTFAEFIYGLAILGADEKLRSLYSRAVTDEAQRRKANAGARPRSWPGAHTPFPVETFAPALGRLGSDWSQAELLELLKAGSARTPLPINEVASIARGLLRLKGPHPDALILCRRLLDGAGGGDPEWDGLAFALIHLYVHLGQEEFKVSGAVDWLEPLLGWQVGVPELPGQEEWSGVRAVAAWNGLGRVTEESLLPALYERVVARLGTGTSRRSGGLMTFAALVARLPVPTSGEGASRRMTESHVAALLRLWGSAGLERGGVLAGPFRFAGRWARGTPIESTVRGALREQPFAAQALAHILGAGGRAELAALRPPGGRFEGVLPKELAEAEANSLSGYHHLQEDPAVIVQVLEESLAGQGLTREAMQDRVTAVRGQCQRLLNVDLIAAAPNGEAFAARTDQAVRALVVEVGGDPSKAAASLEALRAFTAAAPAIVKSQLARFDFDANLAVALEAVERYERLASTDSGTVIREIAELRARREALKWRTTEFDVYAYVPELLWLFEDAPNRFPQADAVKVRCEVLRAFSEFQFVTARQALRAAAQDQSLPAEVRNFAAGLKPKPILSLTDDAH